MQSDAESEIAVVRDWYDATAGTFATRYTGTQGDFWRTFEEMLALELIGPVDGSVLDLGCGTGRLASSLGARATKVVGADVSAGMVLCAHASPHPAHSHYCVTDATRAAFASNAFRAVVSLGMLEYMEDPSPFLREILRVLGPGGRVVFTCHTRAMLPLRGWQFVESCVRGALFRMFAKGRRSDLRRNMSFRPVEHNPENMLSLLNAVGFIRPDYRGFHFLPAVDVFLISARIPVRWLAAAGRNAAVAIDRRLGRWRATRRACALAMYTAEKRP